MARGKMIAAAVTATVLVPCGIVIGLHKTSKDTYVSHFTPTPLASNKPLVQFGIIGDSYTGGSNEGGYGATGWPAIVAKKLNWYLHNWGVGGTGYLSPGGNGDHRFGSKERYNEVAVADLNVLFVVDGVNDLKTKSMPTIEKAALASYQLLKTAAPKAKIVVIGFIPPGNTIPEFNAGNAALKAAAKQAGVLFWDPTNWFKGRYDLIGKDHFHPTDAGHQYLAQLILFNIHAAGLDKLQPAV